MQDYPLARVMSYAKDMPRTTVADAELASELRMGVMRLARRLRQQRTESGLTLTQLSALGTLEPPRARARPASWPRTSGSSRRP